MFLPVAALEALSVDECVPVVEPKPAASAEDSVRAAAAVVTTASLGAAAAAVASTPVAAEDSVPAAVD